MFPLSLGLASKYNLIGSEAQILKLISPQILERDSET